MSFAYLGDLGRGKGPPLFLGGGGGGGGREKIFMGGNFGHEEIILW